MVAGAAAVVLAVDQVVIVGVELDPVVAHPGDQLPARGQLPGADQVGFLAVDGVELVAHQTALAAVVVDEALALLALVVVGQPGGQGDRQIEQPGIALPAQLAAAEASVQFDHATAGAGCAAAKAEILLHVALATIDHQRQLIIVGQPPLIVESGLVVAHGFAGVEGVGLGRGLASVITYLLARQAQRVLGIRLIQAVDQQGQAGDVVDIPAQAQVGDISPGVAVIAVAVGLQPGDVGADIQVAMLATVAQP